MSEPGDWSRSPFMADALHAHNLTAFRRADAHYLHADRWLQDHVVHAMDACPDVIEYWVINAPPMGRAQRLYRYTAQALDHLSEEDKTELLATRPSVRIKGSGSGGSALVFSSSTFSQPDNTKATPMARAMKGWRVFMMLCSFNVSPKRACSTQWLSH